MKFFSRPSFKSLAIGGALALLVSSAFADTVNGCLNTCSQRAQVAYDSTYSSQSSSITNACNSVPDPNQRAACLAAVPTAAKQAAQASYNQVMYQCMQGCVTEP
jgi:hypothetical protein